MLTGHTMTQIEDYLVNSRNYLLRARKRLDEKTPASLFYAAFELRCGVESRMQEYLDAQDHISQRRKRHGTLPSSDIILSVHSI